MNAISTTSTMNQRRRRRFDHIRCCFLLLLASIATTTQGNGVSLFALAERQNNNEVGISRRHLIRRADVNEIANNAVQQLQQAVEDTGEEPVCEEKTDDPVYITKRNRRTKQKKKIEICEWVAKKPNMRCKKFVKKRKRNKDPEIDKKFVKVCYNPKTYCEDVCKDVVEEEQEEEVEVVTEDLPCSEVADPKMSCPLEEADIEGKLGGKTCAGFPIGHKCHYNKVNVGCTAATFRCMPLATCTCRENTATGRDTWDCSTFLPPADYYCEAAPRPKPADWEDPPEGLREACELSENENPTEGEIGIRRRALRAL